MTVTEVFVIVMGVIDEEEEIEIWISQKNAEARIEKLKDGWASCGLRLRLEDWQDDTITSGPNPDFIRSWFAPKSEAYITLKKMEVHE